jgi:hypothetical protein
MKRTTSLIGGICLTISALASMLCLASKLLLKQGQSIFKLTSILAILPRLNGLKSTSAQTQSRESLLEARISHLPKEMPIKTVTTAPKKIQPTLITKVSVCCAHYKPMGPLAGSRGGSPGRGEGTESPQKKKKKNCENFTFYVTGFI